jgi:hypothetical protein
MCNGDKQNLISGVLRQQSFENRASELRIELRCEFTPPFVRSTSGRAMDTSTWFPPGPVTSTCYPFRGKVSVLVYRRHPDHSKMLLTRDHDI